MATRNQKRRIDRLEKLASKSKPAEGQGAIGKPKRQTGKTVTLGKNPKLSELIAWAEQNGLEITFSLNNPMVEAKPVAKPSDVGN